MTRMEGGLDVVKRVILVTCAAVAYELRRDLKKKIDTKSYTETK